MRILVAAPRKSGNTRLRCLLASMYGLKTVGSRGLPVADDATMLTSWLTSSQFPDGSVAHRGFAYSPALAAAAAQSELILIGVLRHPFDLFVSNFDSAQRRGDKDDAESATGSGQAWHGLAGKAIDDPAVFTYLRDEFGEEIAWLLSWSDSGRPIVRLEQLASDPASSLAELADQIAPCSFEQIALAVVACPATNIVYTRPDRNRRVPELPPGAWRDRLSHTQLALLRKQYGVSVKALGYEID
jgi:hypothetical protein